MTCTAPLPGPAGAAPGPALTVAQLDRHGNPSPEVYTAGYFGAGQDSVIRGILGKSARGGA